MKQTHLLLRVYSVKQNRAGLELRETDPPTWEVRADNDSGGRRASIFYHDINPRNLPPLDALIHVTIDEELTDQETPQPPEHPNLYATGADGEPVLISGDAGEHWDVEGVDTRHETAQRQAPLPE